MTNVYKGTSYEYYRQKDCADTLIFIHGLGLNKHMWDEYVWKFKEKYSIVTYDLPGHGESEPCAHAPDLLFCSKQIADLMEHLHIDKAILIGFSLGGMINRCFAVNFPEKTKSLVILNSPHKRDDMLQKTVEDRAKKVQDGGSDATINTALERWFTQTYRESHPMMMDKIRAWRKKNHPKTYANLCKLLAYGVKDLVSDLRVIHASMLVITCENDTGSTPNMSVEIAKSFPNTTLHIIPKLKHMGLMEEPHIFIEWIENFISKKDHEHE